MKPEEIKQLKVLYKKYLSCKSKHFKSLDGLIDKLQDVTGKEIQYNEFASDGLGIAVGDRNIKEYMYFDDALELIKEKGTIDSDDFAYL